MEIGSVADLDFVAVRVVDASLCTRAAHLRAHRAGTMSLLFTEQFAVKDAKPFFDKVTRLSCRLVEGEDLHLDLDVNSDLYPLEVNDRFTLALASTLALDGTPDTGTFDQSGAESLLDQYEYAMYGTVYKWMQQAPKTPVEVHVSYGGLLMKLQGDHRQLDKLTLDARVYLLVRKFE